MASPSRPSVRALREAVQRAVDADSLRSVAKQVGLSAMGLHGFLQGRNPRLSNETKLRKWYAEKRSEGARIWMEWFQSEVPETKRAGVLEELTDAVEEIFRKRGEPPPDWVALLKGRGE